MMDIMEVITKHLDIDDEDNRVFFGKIIGNGAFSVVVRVDYPYICEEVKEKFDSAVLIITAEAEKEEIMKNLLNNIHSIDVEKLRQSAIDDFLSDNGYETMEEAEEADLDYEYFEHISEFNLLPTFEKLTEDGLSVFYMEQCVSETSEEINAASRIFQNETMGIDQPSSFFEDFSLGLTEEDVENSLKRVGVHSSEGDFKTFIKKVYEIIILTERDICKVAETLFNLGVNEVGLDIHDEQYLSYNGKVYCSDPFTIGDY